MPLQNYSLPGSRKERQAPLAERQLLHSVVEIARHVFGAAASSIFLIDEDTGELVFEAVAGEGDAHLPGARFPAGTGIAGWVATSGEPVYVDDLSNSTVFARAAAASTGYVPHTLMAAPLIRDTDCVGVLEVLDPSQASRGELADLDLLALLALQAAIGLEILIRGRRVRDGACPGDEARLLDQIEDHLRTADPLAVTLAGTLLKAADDVLAGRRPGP
ncbi:GAF domain-containing protein [Sphaerisporangium dianthi]|uniref:GAF domain-containing protein n=1 Tax=Sphaerisporangium dianthi TaxID=1436120 RepID=A0ABV9CDI8_9ACTN